MNNIIHFKSIIVLIVLLISIFIINSCQSFHPEEEEPITQRIAFLRDRDLNNDINSDRDIWIMDMDGSNETQLTFDINGIYYLIFSPDGQKICFRAAYSNTSSDIFLMNDDGSELINLTDDDKYHYNPIFTPDGNKLIFTTEMNNPASYNDIFIMSVDGSERTNITNSDSKWYHVFDIKPDGSQILITFPPGHPEFYELYFIDLDGNNQTCITCDITDIAVWSLKITPSGDKIIFHNGLYRIDIFDIDGNNHKNLLQWEIGQDVRFTKISPLNDYILYTLGNYQEIFFIYRMDMKGNNRINLTDSSYPPWAADISYNGENIVFTSKETDNSNYLDIFIMNQFGENKTRLTHNGGIWPKFQPIPN